MSKRCREPPQHQCERNVRYCMGPKGATGATGVQLPTGVNYSDYLFWNQGANAWEVGNEKVHLGAGAGSTAQGNGSVAIGHNAGESQGDFSVAIGIEAGKTQGSYAVAIGTDAGGTDGLQGDYAVAVGIAAGKKDQGVNSVAVGPFAAFSTQGKFAVAIGKNAGQESQGDNAIAIGQFAGTDALTTGQAANSIILNASGNFLNSATQGLFVEPVRDQAQSGPSATVGVMWYDSSSKEITWEQTAKSFIINHPISPDRYLVHACLEGPEAGVYYRGESELTDGETKITLPDYVPDMADNFTVQLTQIWRGPEDSFARLSATRVDDDGAFTVHGDPCAFAWHVHGTRQYIDTEPLKAAVNVLGDGPYRYIR